MAHNLSKLDFNRFGNGLWPRYRGKRAGRLVKMKEQLQHRRIDIVQPSQTKRGTNTNRKTYNPKNCVYISSTTSNPLVNCLKKGSPSNFVPTFLLSNVMSLAGKIDEVCHVVRNANFDFICITESLAKITHSGLCGGHRRVKPGSSQ